MAAWQGHIEDKQGQASQTTQLRRGHMQRGQRLNQAAGDPQRPDQPGQSKKPHPKRGQRPAGAHKRPSCKAPHQRDQRIGDRIMPGH